MPILGMLSAVHLASDGNLCHDSRCACLFNLMGGLGMEFLRSAKGNLKGIVGNHSRIKNVIVATASGLVMIALAGFIVAPTGLTFASTLTTAKISGTSSVVYGKVTNSSGRPIKGARVVLYHYRWSHQDIDAVLYTNSQGLYRRVLHRTGFESVQASYRVGGHLVKSAPRRLYIRKGHAYKVDMRLVSTSKFVFAPIFSY